MNYLGTCIDAELKECQEHYLFQKSSYIKSEFAKITEKHCVLGQRKWSTTNKCPTKGLAYICITKDKDLYDKILSYETDPVLIKAGKAGCKSVGHKVIDKF
jgi:hypothetical protein